MVDTTDWCRKTEAFLYTPPDAALIPGTGLDARREALRNLAVPNNGSPASDLAEADAIAWALEKPPGLEGVSVDFVKRPAVRHPLSGETRLLWDGSAPDIAAVQSTVDAAVQDLRDRYPNDEQFFLVLWRTLPDRLKERETTIGANWDLMPADPRLPDSVWAHAAATSAVATALPKPAFLLFTLASAQKYVSQARRTQDLWMGSFLLSYLIWEAIKTIAGRFGPDVILSPALRAQPVVDRWLQGKGLDENDVPTPSGSDLQVANFPNIFTAILPAEEAATVAEEAVAKLNDRRDEIFEAARKHLEAAATAVNGIDKPDLRELAAGKDNDWQAMWERQRRDFLDVNVFWVVLPWDDEPEAAYDRMRQHLPRNDQDKLPESYQRLESVYREAAQPEEHIGLAYAPLSTWTGRLLTARKNVRHFRQSDPAGEPEHKCSQCGIREALHPAWQEEKKSRHYRELVNFWKALSQVQERKGGRPKLAGRIRRGDRLCAVCATKRLALEAYFTDKLDFDHHLFPSTSTVATANFQEAIINVFHRGHEKLDALYDRLKAFTQAMDALERITYPSSSLPRLKALALERGEHSPAQHLDVSLLLCRFLQIDGDWLFEESFDPEAVAREYDIEVDAELRNALEKARAALKELLEAAAACDIESPTAYYTVIHVDGDHIGDWVAGRRNPIFAQLLHPDAEEPWQVTATGGEIATVKRPMGPGAQAALRTAVGNFAVRIARRVVEEKHAGKLIYAGGDDLLALAPLRDAPGILTELQGHFVSDFEEKDGQVLLLPGSEASTSAGVAVAHRSQPLSQVVEVGRETLKGDAKEGLGRKAFAYRLMKRSGEASTVGHSWEPPSVKPPSPLDILEKLLQWFRGEALSPRLIRDMADEAGGMVSLEPPSTDPQILELQRLVGRHTRSEEAADEIGKSLAHLLQGYRAFIKELKKEKGSIPDEMNAWEMTANFLLLAQFIAKEGQDVDRD